LLDGDGVRAVFVSGTNQVEILREGKRESVSVPISDLAGLGAAIRRLVGKGSPSPVSDAGAVSTTLPDGMHVAAIFPPMSDRLCVAIRRPVAAGKTIEDLVGDGVISDAMRQVLDACVSTRQNILVSGDRAACDSILRAIVWSVDRMARVVLISNSIAPPASASSWIKLQAGDQAPDLVAAAIAMQPEYLIVDANHGALSRDALGECNAGLEGAILSVVARSTSDALHRLQVFGSSLGSASALRDMVMSSIDVVVHSSVLSNGAPKVVEIAEPIASLDGEISTHALLAWIPDGDASGSFTATGARSTLAAKLAAAGASVPPEILNRD
jgi:pilus assembly protein CpaF